MTFTGGRGVTVIDYIIGGGGLHNKVKERVERMMIGDKSIQTIIRWRYE